MSEPKADRSSAAAEEAAHDEQAAFQEMLRLDRLANEEMMQVTDAVDWAPHTPMP